VFGGYIALSSRDESIESLSRSVMERCMYLNGMLIDHQLNSNALPTQLPQVTVRSRGLPNVSHKCQPDSEFEK
jgi:hypothetical protein